MRHMLAEIWRLLEKVEVVFFHNEKKKKNLYKPDETEVDRTQWFAFVHKNQKKTSDEYSRIHMSPLMFTLKEYEFAKNLKSGKN